MPPSASPSEAVNIAWRRLRRSLPWSSWCCSIRWNVHWLDGTARSTPRTALLTTNLPRCPRWLLHRQRRTAGVDPRLRNHRCGVGDGFREPLLEHRLQTGEHHREVLVVVHLASGHRRLVGIEHLLDVGETGS